MKELFQTIVSEEVLKRTMLIHHAVSNSIPYRVVYIMKGRTKFFFVSSVVQPVQTEARHTQGSDLIL